MARERDAPTRVEAVMAEIEGRIAARRLAAGTRLPSVRDLAAAMDVSKSTAVEAYDRLVAAGTITARPGSGFYVAGAARPLAPQSRRPDLDRAIDPFWVTRQSLTCGPEVLKPGWGMLPDSYMPDPSLQKALREVSRDAAPAGRLNYSSPLGHAPLREHIARRLAERGVAAEPDGVMLVDSATHGLDLLLRLLIEPGDTVLVDDPCYFNFLAMLATHRARVVGVPFGREGPDLAVLEQVLAAERPRLYVTTAGPQNPTGATITAAAAHRVLMLAERHGVTVIEDDTFADLEHESSPRLAGFDGLARVVALGCFSKTVSAAIRCGYVAARPDWIEPLVDLKLATSHGSGHLAAVLLHRVLMGGSHKRHVEALRGKLARDMAPATRRIEALGLTPLVQPRAGLFVWAELPGGLDAAAVARAALAEDVLLAPGNVFSTARRTPGHLRFNVTACAEPRIWSVLERAMAQAGRAPGLAAAASSSRVSPPEAKSPEPDKQTLT